MYILTMDHSSMYIALRDYEPRVQKYVEQLDENIEASSGKETSATQQFGNFATDVMGDLAFDESFGLLKGQKSAFQENIHTSISKMGPVMQVPWLCTVGISLPGMMRGYDKMMEWCRERVERLTQVNPQHMQFFFFVKYYTNSK